MDVVTAIGEPADLAFNVAEQGVSDDDAFKAAIDDDSGGRQGRILPGSSLGVLAPPRPFSCKRPRDGMDGGAGAEAVRCMEPLDLTKTPPRSPWVCLDGLYLLARTIDKLRATLPGGNLGVYQIAGFSQRLFETLGIEEEALREVVAQAAGDDEVVAWVRANADVSKYAEVNAMAERRIRDSANPQRFAQNYPCSHELPPDTPIFDVLDRDDREMFERA